MAGKNGGARPGAGRKPKTELYDKQIRAAEKRVADHLPALVDNLLRLAMGVTVEDVDVATGEVMVYKKAPDYKANEYLINRIMGKPTERTENEQVGPLELLITYADD